MSKWGILAGQSPIISLITSPFEALENRRLTVGPVPTGQSPMLAALVCYRNNGTLNCCQSVVSRAGSHRPIGPCRLPNETSLNHPVGPVPTGRSALVGCRTKSELLPVQLRGAHRLLRDGFLVNSVSVLPKPSQPLRDPQSSRLTR